MGSLSEHPLARSERLIVEDFDDELVIYDLDTKVAHALNPLAAAVFIYADGSNTPAEIAGLASRKLDTEVSEAEVAEALSTLASVSLINVAEAVPAEEGVSRRAALKVFAAAGAGTMLVSSVAAPVALGVTTSFNCPNYSRNGRSTGFMSGGEFWPQPGFVESTGTVVNPSSGWNSNGTPVLSYNAPGATTCNYLTSATSTFGGTKGTIASDGSWVCVPCDQSYGYRCCSVVCAPGGSGGTSYGSVGTPYPYGCYGNIGYYGKYCYTCPSGSLDQPSP